MDSLAIGLTVGIPVGIVLLAWFLDWQKKPRLRISQMEPIAMPKKTGRILHVKVVNEPISRLVGWLTQRYTAASCKAWVTFSLENSGDTRCGFWGRWVRAPYPISPVIMGEAVEFHYDPGMVIGGQTMDIGPGGEELLGIALKYEGDKSAWGLSNESIKCDNWKKDDWELTAERYIVQVKVTSGRLSFSRTFTLHNRGRGLRNFRLEPFH